MKSKALVHHVAADIAYAYFRLGLLLILAVLSILNMVSLDVPPVASSRALVLQQVLLGTSALLHV